MDWNLKPPKNTKQLCPATTSYWTQETAKPFNDRQVYTLPFATITGEHLSKKKTDKELF